MVKTCVHMTLPEREIACLFTNLLRAVGLSVRANRGPLGKLYGIFCLLLVKR